MWLSQGNICGYKKGYCMVILRGIYDDHAGIYGYHTRDIM